MSETATVNAYADAAALLSAWWSRPVADRLAVWTRSWPRARWLGVECGLGSVDALSDAAESAAPAHLLDEYERLFVGPGRIPCPPYESLWRGDQSKLEQGRLMSEAAAEVAGLYRTLGLAVAATARELPDHVAIEWEALAVAFADEDAARTEVADALLRDHLRVWVPKLCSAVRSETRSPFYRELAEVTPAWIDAIGESSGDGSQREPAGE